MLDQLPRTEWTVFHDLRWPGRQRANVDHVAVGPTGVFVIDSKNWTGTITTNAGVLRQNGRVRQPTVASAADAARAIARVTGSTSPAHVHPVLCFVRDEAIAARSGEVQLCSTSTLLTQLTSRPPVLTEATRARVFRDIEAYSQSASYAARSARLVRGPGVSTRQPSRKLRQLVAALACFAVGIGCMVTLATSGVPERIGELLTSVNDTETPEEEPRKLDRRGERQKKQAEGQERRRAKD